MEFGKGAHRDRVDNRDFQYHEIASVSAPFDWSQGFNITEKVQIPVKNQGQSYSCGGQAWSYFGEVIEAVATGSFEERSAKFIYSQTFVPGGGSAGRDNCAIAIKQGWAKESLLPSYENGGTPSEAFMERSQDITSDIRSDANKATALSYANVQPNIDLFAQAIRDNNGLIIGIEGSNNGTWLSEFPQPPTQKEWAHWLYAGKAKIIDGKKYIGVLNSWGETCGNKGWQWISEDYINSGHVWNGWVLTYQNGKYIFNYDLQLGDEGEEVRQLQIRLKKEGFFPQEATGFYGSITRKAVFDYQRSKGINPIAVALYKGKYCYGSTRKALNE